jgi:hypothetical protein
MRLPIVAVLRLLQSLICAPIERECLTRGLVLKNQAVKPKADSVNAKVFNLPVIRCRCGAEILLIPDAAATGKAIEAHAQNCSLTKQSKNRSKRTEDLTDYLIEQAFDKAAETKLEENRIPKNFPN